MSAMVGLYQRDGRACDPVALRRMLATMNYRGVRSARWLAGPAGVGLQIGATVERQRTAGEHWQRDPQLLIAADARLDNRQELLAALQAEQQWLSPPDDGELILAAYQRWGEDAPQRLLGDFAFAIWDGARRRFCCARDHFGVKQLYYYCSNTMFACATEIKALLALPGVPQRLNEARLGALLLAHSADKETTLFQGILRLAPATTLLIDSDRVVRRTYWSLDPQREIRLGSLKEYSATYRALLTEAVRCRLPATGAAAALSGGLDSSAIACVARDLLAAQAKPPLHIFSAVYDAVPQCDERPFINAVLRQGAMQPHFVQPEQYGPLTAWEGEDWQADEPLWNPQIAPTWTIHQATKAAGSLVVLEGFAGDLVTGYDYAYLTELAQRGALLKLTREAILIGKRLRINPWAIVGRRLRSLAPAWLRAVGRRSGRLAAATSWQVPLREEFARRYDLAANATAAYDAARQQTQRSRQYEALNDGWLSAIALNSVDRITALLGTEARLPFLDVRLVEFCLALPPELKLRNGWSRWLARYALQGVAPEAVRWRTDKSNLGPAFDYGMIKKDRAMLDKIFLTPTSPIGAFVDLPQAHAEYKRYLANPKSGAGFTLWRIASLDLWLRRLQTG